MTTRTPDQTPGAAQVTAPGGTSRTSIALRPDPHGGVASLRTSVDANPTSPVVRAMLLREPPTPGPAKVCLVPEGALLLAGDRVRIEVSVGTGCALDLVESGGTVAYDMRGGSGSWEVSVSLGGDASLSWHGLPFVASAGADVRRSLDVRLSPGARLLLRETTVLGRVGEPGGRVVATTRVDDPHGPVLVEELRLGPEPAPGLLAPHRVVDTVLALGPTTPGVESQVPRYDLDRGGAVWRALSGEAHSTGVDRLWTGLRAGFLAG